MSDEQSTWIAYDDIPTRREIWEKRCEAEPFLLRIVHPDASRKDYAHCLFCGQLVRSKRMHQHVNMAECTAVVNYMEAMRQGYVQGYVGKGLTPGHLSRSKWAQPYIKEFASKTTFSFNPKTHKREVVLDNHWWAMEWWWPFVRFTYKQPDQAKTMQEVHELYVAGKHDELYNLLGGLELSSL